MMCFLSFNINSENKNTNINKKIIIPDGIMVDGIEIGNYTIAEAKDQIDSYVKSLRNKKLTLVLDGKEFTTTLGDIGYTYKDIDFNSIISSIGKTGNIIERYRNIKDVSYNKLSLNLEFVMDAKKIEQFINKLKKYEYKPINATAKIENGKLYYLDSIYGMEIDFIKTRSSIIKEIINNKDKNNYVVNTSVKNIKPKYLNEDMAQCKDIIGSFTTKYTNSAQERASNLSNGAKLLNNIVVYPGEIFSAYKYLAPFTPENGYYEAGAFSDGKVIDTIGGGACQVTTTLYNALLMAELEIIERHEHSMTVSYVELARDAAIAGKYKDLKFKNNTNTPILIEAIAKNRQITFNIWGKESRKFKTRSIKYETVVISELPPQPDVIIEDNTKPRTYKKTTQTARKGYVAELYKLVFENEIEISRELINTSTYNPASKHITIGTLNN